MAERVGFEPTIDLLFAAPLVEEPRRRSQEQLRTNGRDYRRSKGSELGRSSSELGSDLFKRIATWLSVAKFGPNISNNPSPNRQGPSVELVHSSELTPMALGRSTLTQPSRLSAHDGQGPRRNQCQQKCEPRALAIGRTEREIGIAYNIAYGLLTEKRVEIGIA
jgi:hypothetical protein